MDKILIGLEGVICLMNDILIHAYDEAAHWDRLELILDICNHVGLNLRKDKCEFATTIVNFLVVCV